MTKKPDRYALIRQRKQKDGFRASQVWLNRTEKTLMNALRAKSNESISEFFSRLVREESAREWP